MVAAIPTIQEADTGGLLEPSSSWPTLPDFTEIKVEFSKVIVTFIISHSILQISAFFCVIVDF
jgi:hypothetical protein